MIDLLKVMPPGIILMLGPLLLPLLKGRARLDKAWLVLMPLLSFIHLITMDKGFTIELFGYTLMPVRIDSLSLVWGYVFHIAAFLGAIYAIHVEETLEHVSAMSYAGSAIGAVFAGDLATLFLYWEATAITSVFLIWARRNRVARRTGMRYLVIQVASGVLLLGGTVIHLNQTGSLMFEQMSLGLDLFDIKDRLPKNGVEGLGSALIFLAFGIKAAFPLLHSWLKSTYPEGTHTGTVFLSVFTTKLAIYALARGFAGEDLLIPIGAVMTVFPIFYAVIENDLRRVLSYSLNNQLGFMVVGVGLGTELSLNGTAAHAFAHILYKSLLFMSMGAVLYRAGTVKANELGGLWKSMPKTAIFCIIGSLSISGFPGFSGFVSKSMILSEVGIQHMTFLSLVLLLASAGVVDHSGIKIPFFSFFFHDSGKRVEEAPLNMLIAMGGTAALCIGIGLFPKYLYAILPYQGAAEKYLHDVYSWGHIISYLHLLLFAALAFTILMRKGIYPPEVPSINLDIGWVYRRAFPNVLHGIRIAIESSYSVFRNILVSVCKEINAILSHTYSPGGILGEPWSTGRTTFWAALLLAGYLLLNYLR